MGATTEIAWTHATFNPWIGCAKVAPGCTNCYAEAYANRYGKAEWGVNGTRVKTSASYWKQPHKWNREAEAANERRRVFCASLADVFEDWGGPILNAKGERLYEIGDSLYDGEPSSMSRSQPVTMSWMRRQLFALIDATPRLDWLLLTKRPENINKFWPQSGYEGDDHNRFWRPNVWLLTSVSEQESADRNIPKLLTCRYLVPVLGISAEPLVGALDLWPHLPSPDHGPGITPYVLDWVIVGGESGGNRRTCEADNIVRIVRQCQDAFVPCFVKQDAGLHAGTQGRIPDDIWSVKEFPQPHGAEA